MGGMRKDRTARVPITGCTHVNTLVGGEREKGLHSYESTHPEDARTHKLESVVVRIKKLEENEKPTLHADPKDKTILYFDKDFEIEQYHFDIVFDGDDDNEKVFLEIGGHTIVHNVCRGFKETVIAYGQTGSGKTYTLFGSNQELGIIHYFLRDLYRVKCNDLRKKTIYLSLYEVVGDKLVDLMTNVSERNTQFYTQDYYLKTIRHSYKVVNISSFEMAKKIIDTACLMRNVEATSQNRRSSRSHAIIHLFVNTSDLIHHDGMETTRDYYGVLTFVDLVGCEREEFNTQGSQNRNEKTSSKFLNSSLTSLNKMLRKMQMGNLDESDKRQSVLCKVLFNYIKKTCGVCLIFCFNPRQCQKSLTSSTLIMASECKKIKSKRKQLLYVKTENRDHFFKRITHGKGGRNNGGSPLSGESHSRTSKRDSSKETWTGKEADVGEEAPSNGNAISDDATMVLVHSGDVMGHQNGTHVITLRKGNEKQEALKKIVCELVHMSKEEEKEKEKTIQKLHSDVDRLTKECSHWKRQAHNYHKKLILLHRNYAKIRELLFNTLHSGGNDISVGTFRSSTSCYSFVQPDEDNSLIGGNIYVGKDDQRVKKESPPWGKKQLTERDDPVRQGDGIPTGDVTSYEKKHYGVSSGKASNRSDLSKGMDSFTGSKQGRKEEQHRGGYSHQVENVEYFDADTLEKRHNKEGSTQRKGSYSGIASQSSTLLHPDRVYVDGIETNLVQQNSEQTLIKGSSSAKVVPTGGTPLETKRDVRNANHITIDSLTTKIRNRILKSRSLSTAG
ncbi:Kinesin-like protein [Plasmodium coatneyi]|uniref:Kinesin-like protein n=1 Tax=Plasmodium coatneyi TaxID=208452 RepID=A0A1B1DTE3_9APIC|nr:Kinesin-like protein [Plasmodium coatneyi]ANQ05855.1 Kinesin-like protein [Plasmodium coatneyi]